MMDHSCFDFFPELESDRLFFRQLEVSDAPSIYSIRTNDSVMKHMDTERPNSIADSEEFIEENRASYKRKEGIYWGIVEKASQKVVGDFVYWRLVPKHFRAEIGYTLHPDYWGKGYMKEAMSTLINYGFNTIGIHSFEANINPQNDNSRRALLKVGFQKEAYFKESFYYNGKFLDSEIYSLLQQNFIY